ncbi:MULTISPECIES: hypothetical protein [Spirulina sp. CCY15215]|uniref:hypothetical protein n=1 Tax=Spirulina sp. CCY15215 TaxID=2767591 RepID=UPI00194DD8C4|nr:hypothetical protein [Spirulina major]
MKKLAFLIRSLDIALFLKLFLPKTRIFWGVRASNLDLSQYDWFERIVDNFSVEKLVAQTEKILL